MSTAFTPKKFVITIFKRKLKSTQLNRVFLYIFHRPIIHTLADGVFYINSDNILRAHFKLFVFIYFL